MNDIENILKILESNDFFKSITNVDLARIISTGDIIDLKKDDTLYDKNDKAIFSYIILNGSALLIDGDKKQEATSGRLIGTESVFDAIHYKEVSIINEDTKVLRISNVTLQTVIKNNEKATRELCLSSHNLKREETVILQTDKASSFRIILAWMLSFIVPIIVYFLIDDAFSFPARIFLATLSSSVVLWIFNIVHDFIPGILILIVTLVLGLVPSEIILSGFTSDTYILMFSLSGLAVAIVSSGLLYRLIALMIRYIPMTNNGIKVGLYLLGLLITPVIPSIVNRTRLIAPVITNMLELLRVKKGSRLATMISIASYSSVTSHSNIFLTGSIMNLTALALLPLQEQFQIAAIGWTVAAIVPFFILFLTNILGLSVLYHSKDKIHLDVNMAKSNLKALGPVTPSEWEAITAISFFSVSLMLISYLQLNLMILSLFIFFAMTALKTLSLNKWVKNTDWAYLLFMGVVIGLAKSMNYLGIDALLTARIIPLFDLFGGSTVSILSCIIGLTLLIRFILPVGPAFVLMASLIIPISEFYGMSIWIGIFTLLMVCDIWFFSYQVPFYKGFVEEFDGNLPYNKKDFLTFNLINNAARILSIYFSIPVWRYLGLI